MQSSALILQQYSATFGAHCRPHNRSQLLNHCAALNSDSRTSITTSIREATIVNERSPPVVSPFSWMKLQLFTEEQAISVGRRSTQHWAEATYYFVSCPWFEHRPGLILFPRPPPCCKPPTSLSLCETWLSPSSSRQLAIFIASSRSLRKTGRSQSCGVWHENYEVASMISLLTSTPGNTCYQY